MRRFYLWLRKRPGLCSARDGHCHWSLGSQGQIRSQQVLALRSFWVGATSWLAAGCGSPSTLNLGFTSTYMICFCLSELFFSSLFPSPYCLDFFSSFQLGLGPIHINLWCFVQWLVEYSALTWLVSVYIGVLLCYALFFFPPNALPFYNGYK